MLQVCVVLVLFGPRLFAPTFLLRLTAHDKNGHMDSSPDKIIIKNLQFSV